MLSRAITNNTFGALRLVRHTGARHIPHTRLPSKLPAARRAPRLESRLFSATSFRKDASEKPPSHTPPPSSSNSPETPQTSLSFQPPEPRLSITFTCTVTDCGTRSTHEFTKRSYTKGIVIVQCPGCENRHLIADHLGWFKESTEEGKLKTIEDLMRAKGEKVQRGSVDSNGVIEYTPEDH
ncbi:zf-DNL domain-containing protein [Phanerochaete sordida]|uniref:Zf-DNL domain-containing protein n=1 Tax=Phanerochaete sordida TaxID=48140 RepID=A0A9P3GQM3_9APHY|nr:zf-DNL domain-containing protein [Phanerochaete sordida]